MMTRMKTMVLRGTVFLLFLLCTISPGLIDAAVPNTLTNLTLYNQVLIDWYTANALCQSEGKHLIRVEDAEKHAFLKEAVKELISLGYQNYINKNIWIDAYAPIPGVADFLWSTCSQLPFISWQPSYPQNLTDNRCLLLDTSSSNLSFRNNPCSSTVNVVCEQDLKTPCRFIHHPNSGSPSLLSGLNLLATCESQCSNSELCWAYTVSGVLVSTCQFGTMGVHESWVPYLTGYPDISSLATQNPVYIKRCYGYIFSGTSQAPIVSAQFPNCSVTPSVESYSTISILTTEQLAVLPSPNEVSPTVESFSTVSATMTDEFHVLPTEALSESILWTDIDVFTLSQHDEIVSEVTEIWATGIVTVESTEDYIPIPTQISTVDPAVDVSTGAQEGLILNIVPTTPDLTPTLLSEVVQGSILLIASLTPALPDLTISDLQVVPSVVLPVPTISDLQVVPSVALPVPTISDLQVFPSVALPVPTISDLLQVVPSVGFPLDVLKPSQIRQSNLCSCFCKFNTNSNQAKEIEQETSSIVKELTVNHSTVSMTRRKLTSASDDRQSSLVMGLLGVGILTGTCLIVVIPDVTRFISWIRFRTEKARLLASQKNDDEEGGHKVCYEIDGEDLDPGETMSDPVLTEGESEV